jgi:two-component system, NtrC family, sensor kinase
LIAEHDHSARIELDEPALGGSFLCTAYPLQDAEGGLIGTVNVLKDITVEKRLQAQVIHSEKLAATGKLATSLAHEINNPLQGIQGCLDLAGENVGGGERAGRYLTMAKSELERLTNIVRRILDLYRPSKAAGAPVDARVVLEDVLGLCAKRMQAANIVVRIEWDRSLPAAFAGDDQIKQVFLNLILNAIDAMPDGGELTIRNRFVDGAWLTIELADTGVGIPSETLELIFDPFYTTKPEGTGLGLAVCSNILAGCGGRLTAESELDQGSTFTVWLPVR